MAAKPCVALTNTCGRGLDVIDSELKETMEAGLENLAFWAGMRKQKPNIPLLKEAVEELCHMMQQKTAGQRRDKPQDVPFEALPRLKMTILCEAAALVLSGALDSLEEANNEDI